MIPLYGRVSSKDQHLDVQQARLAAVCDRVILEQGSATTMHRPHLQEILRWLNEGDTLVVCKLDRLARSLKEGVNVLADWCQRGVRIIGVPRPLSDSQYHRDL